MSLSADEYRLHLETTAVRAGLTAIERGEKAAYYLFDEGVTTMLANAGGPVWQMHLLPQKMDKLTYVGTMAMLFAVSNVIKIGAFGTLGFLTTENLLVGLALVPVAVIANYIGIWLVQRTSPELFFRIAYVLMFFIALELMRSSILELWR